MSILSGFFKTKKYRKTDDGYKLQSEWTSSETVEMGDGNTAEENLGAIQGITSSLASTSNNFALSASAGKDLQDQISDLNTDLTNVGAMAWQSNDSENFTVLLQQPITIYEHTFTTNQLLNFCARITVYALSANGTVELQVHYNNSILQRYTLNNVLSWDLDIGTTIGLLKNVYANDTIKITAYIHQADVEKTIGITTYGNY